MPVRDPEGDPDALGVRVTEPLWVSVTVDVKLRDGVRACVVVRVIERDVLGDTVGPAVKVAVFVVV